MEEREKKRFCVIGASLDPVNFQHPMVIKHGSYEPFVLYPSMEARIIKEYCNKKQNLMMRFMLKKQKLDICLNNIFLF
jgi:hypothetical protein